MSNPLSKHLHDRLRASLNPWITRDMPLVARLEPKAPVFRRCATPTLHHAMAVRLADLADKVGTPWRAFGNLKALVSDALDALPPVGVVRRWTDAMVPLLAVRACDVARPLIDQLGPSTDRARLDRPRFAGDLQAAIVAVSQDAARARLLLDRAASRIVDATLRGAAAHADGRGRRAALLRFRGGVSGTIAVEWLAGDGAAIQTTSLSEFVQLTCLPEARRLQAELKRLHAASRGHRDAGIRALRRVNRHLARLADEARATGQCTGIRLLRTRTRTHAPVEVWLHMNAQLWPGADTHALCSLSAYRGHREFVLEAASGSLFYFPPVLLVARFTLSQDGLAVLRPGIRQPVGGFPWCHPYTGNVGADPFAGARVHPDDGSSAMLAPSNQALRLFPQLHQRRETAGEKQMCLARQDTAVADARKRYIDGPLAAGAEPAMARTADHLWNLLRRGLCCGHQLNTSSPVAALSRGAMLYPLDANAVTGALAQRVFPFDPGRPFQKARTA